MWDEAIFYIFAMEAYFALYAMLMTINVFLFEKEIVFDYIMLCLLTPMFLVELWEIKIMKQYYFTDMWNIIDTFRVGFSYYYLISHITGFAVNLQDGCKAVSLMLSWLRLISLFRCFKSTRYLVRIVLAIAHGMVPFMLIFFFSTFFNAIGFGAMRRDEDFIDEWTKSWRLSFGEFEDMGEYATPGEVLIFFFSCTLIPLLLLNLLVAIMGDIYNQVQENMEIADTKERLQVISEISHLIICKRSPKPLYIHQCETKELADAENDDWSGQVNALKTGILKKIEILQLSVDERVEEMTGNLKRLDEHTVKRYKTLQDNEIQREKKNVANAERIQNHLKSQEQRINNLEFSMNAKFLKASFIL